ncbi:hypothetical protein M3J09_003919 [Ascochyta lentis]
MIQDLSSSNGSYVWSSRGRHSVSSLKIWDLLDLPHR